MFWKPVDKKPEEQDDQVESQTLQWRWGVARTDSFIERLDRICFVLKQKAEIKKLLHFKDGKGRGLNEVEDTLIILYILNMLLIYMQDKIAKVFKKIFTKISE